MMNNVASQLIERVKSTGSAMRSGPVLFWSIALLTQLPLLVMYLSWIWQFEHYQYFPFLLVAISWLGWTRITEPIKYPVGRLAATLFAASMFVLLIGSVLGSPWFASISFFLLAASFFVAQRLAYLCVPLLLLIRLPMSYDMEIITGLQTLTSRLSSFILDLLYIPHLARGNVIELADRDLFVAEACSGVQSAFTIAFIALLIAAWQRRPFSLIPVYLVIALAWAVLCNTLRVTAIAYAAVRLQLDLSSGIAHDVLGYSTLLLAALLTLSTDALLALIFHPLEGEYHGGFNLFIEVWEWLFDTETKPKELTIERPLSGWRALLYGPRRGAIISVVVLGLISFVPLVAHAISTPQAVNAEGKVLIEPASAMFDQLPGSATFQFADSVRGGSDPRLGMNADQWDMQFGGLTGKLVFSQPYPEWHELSLCYSGQGWGLKSTNLLQPSASTPDITKIKLARLQREDGALGYLLYAGLHRDGTAMNPPGDSMIHTALARCAQLVSARDTRNFYSGDCAMLQIWIVTDSELEGEVLSSLVDVVSQARGRFAKQLAESK